MSGFTGPLCLFCSLEVVTIAGALSIGLAASAGAQLPQGFGNGGANANHAVGGQASDTTLSTAFALGSTDPRRALALDLEAVQLSRPGERSLSWGIAGDLAARQGAQRDALQYWAKAIENSDWLGNRLAVGNVIGRVGDLLAESDHEATAVLQSAGDALAPGYAHAPHTVEARQQSVATVEASPGAERREKLYQQGLAMTDDEAVTYAEAAITRWLEDQPPSATSDPASG